MSIQRLLTLLTLILVVTPLGAQTFVRGDCNGDDQVNIADPIGLLGYLFTSGSIDCASACDGNDDGQLNIADSVSLLGYLFSMGPDPSAPFPNCGSDATPDSLDCLIPTCSVGPQAPYERIPQNVIVDDLRRVRWHTSGDFALLLGLGGAVARYDESTGMVTPVTTLGVSAVDLDVSADGSIFMVVGLGSDGLGRLWRIAVDPLQQLTVTEELTISQGTPMAIELSPDGTTWAIGSTLSTTIQSLDLWQDGVAGTTTVGFNSSAGLIDLMWGDPALYGGSANVIFSCGINGADSLTYVAVTGMVVSNNWSAGFGNPGGAGWRPGGSFGILAGWSSNRLYVFDGAWTNVTLPGIPSAASPQMIRWNEDGTRALIVGRAIANPLAATVYDYFPGTNPVFDVADLTNVSIASYNDPPWNGSASMYLFDVDWRPGPCAEGLIVGSDDALSGFGMLIRFQIPNAPGCPVP